MGNLATLKPFKKGKGVDPRINRNGRPKSFDKLRKLAQQLAHEIVKDKNGNPIIRDNAKQTQITELLRDLIKKDPVKFLEYAFGKPKEKVEVSGNEEKPIVVKVINGVSMDDL